MIEAHFENIRNLIIDNIRASKSEIKIAVAWFTQRQLYDAVLDALERDVKVSLIMMKDFINCGIYGLPLQSFVDKGGLLHFVTSRGWTMHNKFCLFDNSMVISGSYNWTYSAETRNAENVIATDEDNVCARFDDYYNRLWEESFAEETIPKVEISSEEVIKDFAIIHDEIDAMLKNEIIPPSHALKVLEEAKANVAAKVATVKRPIMPSLTPVYFGGEPLKSGEIIMTRTIALKTANGNWEFAKQGTKLPYPFSPKNDFVNTVSIDDGIIVLNIEKYKEDYWYQTFGSTLETDKEKLELIRIEGLPSLPAGKLRIKVSGRISESGLLSVTVYCRNTMKTNHVEIQLVENEDFIVGK